MKRTIRKLQLMNFFFYVLMVVTAGFGVPYLKSLGMSNTEVGQIMAWTMVAGIVGQFVMGYVCDLKKTIKKVFIAQTVLFAIITTYMFFTSSLTIKLIILPIAGFLRSSIVSLTDSWILEIDPTVKENYGKVRAFGSLGWGISAIIIGKWIDSMGWTSLGYVHLVLSVILLLTVMSVKDVEKSSDPESKVTMTHLKSLLMNRNYIYIVTLFTLLFISMQMYAMFMPLLIEAKGGGQVEIGMFFMISSFSEIPMFFFTKKLIEKMRVTKILIISSVAFVIKLSIAAFAGQIFLLVSIGAMNIVTFTLTLFAAKQLVDEVSPDNLKTSAQTIAMSIYFGVSGFIAYNFGGLISDQIGIKSTLILQAAICLIAVAMSVRYHVRGLEKDHAVQVQKAIS